MIPLRWARCKRGPIFGLGLLTLASAVRADAPNAQNAWIEARPAGAAEVALRQAILSGRVELAPLEAVSTANPGSTASGLAQLAAGLVLLDSSRFAEALPHLRHPDLARTALADHALLAVARAEEGLGDPARAAQAYLGLLKAHLSPLACVALAGAALTLDQASRGQEVIAMLERTAKECPSEAPAALLSLASLHQREGRAAAAAQAYDRLDREFPASTEARGASARLTALQSASGAAGRRTQRAGLPEGGGPRERLALREAVPTALSSAAVWRRSRAEVRCAWAALLTLKRYREAVALAAVPLLAYRCRAAYFWPNHSQRQPAPAVYETWSPASWVRPGRGCAAEPGPAFGKGCPRRSGAALPPPVAGRLPQGRYADRATWRVAWGSSAPALRIAAEMLSRRDARGPRGLRPRASCTGPAARGLPG